MKRTNFILNGFLALATVLVFAQCTDKNNNASTTSNVAPVAGVAGSSNMKIAYVEIDSLLTKYNFWNDLNEAMISKEENIRTTLNEKGKKLEAEAREFERKLQNGGFASRERAEQEQMRLMKQQQDLQALQQKLSAELADENQKNSLQLRDSINSFLKIYNQNKGYDLIISNTGFDNLLYANPAYNITQEIIDGLNARYTSSTTKKSGISQSKKIRIRNGQAVSDSYFFSLSFNKKLSTGVYYIKEINNERRLIWKNSMI